MTSSKTQSLVTNAIVPMSSNLDHEKQNKEKYRPINAMTVTIVLLITMDSKNEEVTLRKSHSHLTSTLEV